MRLSIRIILGVLLAAAAAVLPACDPSSKRTEALYTEDDTKVEVGRDVEILYSDSAFVRVRVQGPTMMNYTDRVEPRQEFPDGIKVEFLNTNLQVTSTLTAKTAVREQDKGLITVRDDVTLVTAEKEKLETEELIWDERSGKVHTDKFVKVTKPGEVLYGLGLEATQDFSYWRILVPKGRLKTDQIDQAVEQ